MMLPVPITLFCPRCNALGQPQPVLVPMVMTQIDELKEVSEKDGHWVMPAKGMVQYSCGR